MAANTAASGQGRAVLVSTWQIEGPFLLEWVAYHRAIGFDAIILPGHERGDGAPELLAALTALGWVRVVECGAAPPAAALVAGAAPRHGDWVMLLGADEYLNIHAGARTVQSLIAHMGPARAMLIAARVFGDSGQEAYPGRTISPAFTQAAAQQSRHNNLVRSFYAHGPQVREAGEHRPRLAEGQAWAAGEVLTAADRPMNPGSRQNRRWLEGAARSFSGLGRAELGWVVAQVNQYRVRSPEIFALRARAAAQADPAPARPAPARNKRSAEAQYDEMNLNDQEDRSILHWQAATEALMAEARKDPAVDAALALVAERLAASLDDLSRNPGLAPEGAEPVDAAVREAAGFVPKMWFPEPVKAFVQERYLAAECILEYGSGGSTVFAARETRARVLSIESDRKWAANLTAYLAREGLSRPDVVVKWADIGPTRDWGVPRDARLWGRFQRYPMLPWQDPEFAPDLVLIDGRFRAGCLAATLLHCKRPTTVLIDDYANRKGYHIVEALVPITRRIGHMACFEITPQAFSNQDFAQMLPWFFSWE